MDIPITAGNHPDKTILDTLQLAQDSCNKHSTIPIYIKLYELTVCMVITLALSLNTATETVTFCSSNSNSFHKIFWKC